MSGKNVSEKIYICIVWDAEL